jgi:hypothetical protein
MQGTPSIRHPAFVDPRYWDDRLRALNTVPRQLLVFPRNELALPGADASELWLRAHDRTRLRALFARSAVATPRSELLLGIVEDLHGCRFDWDEVADGRPQLLVEGPRDRRLEDRVLDVLRVLGAARELAGLGQAPIALMSRGTDRNRDELQIVERLLAEGRG